MIDETSGSEEQDRASAQRLVGSVKAAIAILRHLQRAGRGMGVNAIARALELSPSSCFNLLKTLVDEEFLDFDPSVKLYTLGPGAIALGRSALDPYGAFAMARRKLEALADAHHVTIGLWRVRRGEQLLLLGFAESEATTRIHITVGHRVPIAAGAAGRCALAFSELDARAVAARVRAVKWATTPDLGTFLKDLATTRERRWSLDENGFLRGVTTLAAPVLNSRNLLELCITATMFTGQHEPDNFPRIAEDLKTVGLWISERMFSTDPTGQEPAKLKPLSPPPRKGRKLRRKKPLGPSRLGR